MAYGLSEPDVGGDLAAVQTKGRVSADGSEVIAGRIINEHLAYVVVILEPPFFSSAEFFAPCGTSHPR